MEPGDGHATVASQLWLAPQERLALAAEPARVDGDHFELILAPAAQRQLLAYLREASQVTTAAEGAHRPARARPLPRGGGRVE